MKLHIDGEAIPTAPQLTEAEQTLAQMDATQVRHQSEALWRGIIWAATPEGYDYWDSKYRALRSLATKIEAAQAAQAKKAKTDAAPQSVGLKLIRDDANQIRLVTADGSGRQHHLLLVHGTSEGYKFLLSIDVDDSLPFALNENGEVVTF